MNRARMGARRGSTVLARAPIRPDTEGMTRARLTMTSCALASTFAISDLTAASGCNSDDTVPDQPIAEGGALETAAPVADTSPPRLLGPAVECQIGSAIEAEPNDTPATANAFTELSFCGVIDGAKDVDYLTFDTPSGTKLGVFQAIIDGSVDFELTLAGATFGPADTDKFGSGTYLVKAFTKSTKGASYRIRVQYDPI